jgi:hypothetical protein
MIMGAFPALSLGAWWCQFLKAIHVETFTLSVGGTGYLPEQWRTCTMYAFLPFIEIRGASFLTNR